MKHKYCALTIVLAILLIVFPLGVQAAYQPPQNWGAPVNVGVVFNFTSEDNWSFNIGYGASKEIRDILTAENDGSFGDAGFENLMISVQADYKLDNGSWKSAVAGSEELPQNGPYFDAEAGKYTDQNYIYYYDFEDYFQDGVLPGGEAYFNDHTMHFRVRFCIDFDDESNDYEYFSPWSETVSYNNAQVEDPTKLINHAPILKSAEIKKYSNGEPYLYLTAEKAHDDIQKLNSISNQGVKTNVWLRVGSGEWKDNGTYGVGLEGFEVEIDDYFDNAGTSFEAAVYEVKFRYEFDYDNYPAAAKTGCIFSPFSNTISHGMPAFSYASAWAIEDLNKAAEYGFITERIKNNMAAPITREEFAEIAVRFYEKFGNTATYKDMSAFTDTTNPEIFKAYEANILSGVGNNKFAPNNLIKRQEIAAMVTRAVKAVRPNADFSTAGVAKFPDEHLIADWALEVVRFANKNRLIGGLPDGRIDPLGTTTREQAVLIIFRAYEKYKP